MHETEPRLPLIAQLPEPHYSTFSQFPGLSVKMSTVILVSAPPPPHNQKKNLSYVRHTNQTIVTRYNQ